MDFEELIKKEESKELVRVDEGQLIVAEEIQKQLIEMETLRKKIDKKVKEIKNKIEYLMREYGITKYESNDKRILITLGEDGENESVDSNELFLKYPDIYRELVKVTKRKGTFRFTIRESEKND